MKKSNGILYIMVGLPGSGKSTYLQNYTRHDEVVSRDAVRFSLVKEDEDYFSREPEVYREFVGTIANLLRANFNVYADATHFTKKARKRLIQQIKDAGIEPRKIVAIEMDTPLIMCLFNNAKRTGRERVPDDVIQDMAIKYEAPTLDEKYLDAVYKVNVKYEEN